MIKFSGQQTGVINRSIYLLITIRGIVTSAEVSPAWPPGISWASICVSNQRKNQEDHPSLIKINDKKAVDIIASDKPYYCYFKNRALSTSEGTVKKTRGPSPWVLNRRPRPPGSNAGLENSQKRVVGNFIVYLIY